MKNDSKSRVEAYVSRLWDVNKRFYARRYCAWVMGALDTNAPEPPKELTTQEAAEVRGEVINLLK